MPNTRQAKRENGRKRELDLEVATGPRADLMEALIAACALVAHADGKVDEAERRRVLQLMRALPIFAGFSTEAVAAEFQRHEQAFAYEPHLARDKALDAIESLKAHPGQVRLLISACQHVLEADGIYHPQEYQALRDVSKALGAS